MNVLVLGSGGREHAVTWKIAQSSQIDKLFIAPGNAGTAMLGTNIDLSVDDFEGIRKFSVENQIDFIMVGPEGPLVNGIVDFFESDPSLNGITVIGPNKKAAQLEGSKDFSKAFMKKYNIPTAKYCTVTKDNIEDGFTFLDAQKAPYVLKADGLASGKGVLILDDLNEAKSELKSMINEGKFGDASAKVVIEQFLDGVELSVFIVTDGQSYKILPEAKDYKRIGEGDTGLNTGGMGAISPVVFQKAGFMDKVLNQVIIPTVKGLRKEEIDYKGFIFFGLINVKNDPYVIEYNCRLGDPETEVILPRLKSDILELFEGIATKTLSERDVEIDDRVATGVMMVSGGYPDSYEKEKSITGLNTVYESLVFHSGTKKDGPNTVTSGGRVLCVTSLHRKQEKALEKTYENLEKISFDKAYYRKDIGFDLVKVD